LTASELFHYFFRETPVDYVYLIFKPCNAKDPVYRRPGFEGLTEGE